MKRILAAILCGCLLVATAGCGNLSPRFDPKLDQKIDNQNGKLHDLENISNGMKNELGKLQQESAITNSKLDHVQNGLANLQSSNTNSGIQVLSGTGGLLVALVGGTILIFLVVAYRRSAIQSAKTADILADQVVTHADPALKENVFKAAMYSDVENEIYSLIQRHEQSKLRE